MKRLLLILSALLLSISLFSQSEQIERLREQQKIILEDIKSTNNIYIDVKKQTTTLLQRINLINKQISSRKQMVSLQQKEIDELLRELGRIEAEIKKLNEDLKRKQDSYANAVRIFQKNLANQNELFFILSGKSFGESLRRMQYLKEYSKWRKSQTNELKEQNKKLIQRKEDFEKTKEERVLALKALEEEQKKLKTEEDTRQKEMKAAQGKQKELQKTLQNKERQAKELNAKIEAIIREEVERQERETAARRKAEEASKKAKDKETTTESKETSKSSQPAPKVEASKADVEETFVLSKSFVANKGKLPMPVTGTSTIVSQFGINRHSEWNISTNSNGIDIQAQKGATIRSVFEGEVSKVVYFPGMNTCLIVRHGEYYTFYANIYDLHVKIGDKVKTGQSLGSIYTDPDTGVASMHFQLWHKTSKLNPAPWLKR